MGSAYCKVWQIVSLLPSMGERMRSKKGAVHSTLLRPHLNMSDIKLGDIVPDFEQDSTHGPIRFHEYLGDGWGILFSHPKDYTVRLSLLAHIERACCSLANNFA